MTLDLRVTRRRFSWPSSTTIPIRVWRELEQSGLSPSARLVLLFLVWLSGNNEVVEVGSTDLCAVTGLSRSTLSRSVERLVEAGLVEVEDRGPGRRKVYRVTNDAGLFFTV